jgi:hypothetical protein
MYSLVLRTLQLNGSFVAHVTRIQNGFMVESNLQQALDYITDVQKELISLQTTLRNPSSSPPPYTIPMK